LDLSQVTLISVIGTTDRLDGQVGRLVAVDDIEAMAQNILE